MQNKKADICQELTNRIPVEKILRSFDSLPDIEKREIAYEIIRRTLEFNFPPLSDDDLVLNAEEILLEFDRNETCNILTH